MHPAVQALRIFAQVVGGVAVFAAMVYGVAVAGKGVGVMGLMLLLLVNGWAVYAYLRYRQGRQDEFAQLLAAAVAGGMPLAPAVRSYLDDRPRRGIVGTLFQLGSYLVLPLYTYVRLWVGSRPFESLVERFAHHLESGEPLNVALRAVPGVANREVRLAAAVGEETDSLGPCLRSADRERWTTCWLEIAPRIIYPFIVLTIVMAVSTFLIVLILPKYRRIFDEFGETLPPLTLALVEFWEASQSYMLLAPLAVVAGVLSIAAVISSPTLRWYLPLIGPLYRSGVQSEVLRSLGQLLAAGRTVPQALQFLAYSDDLPGVVQGKLGLALAATERGEPLDAALNGAGLLPSNMVPLVRSAQRVQTLPWALGELGEGLSGKAFRIVRKLTLVAAPLLIVAVGAVVAFVALAMFMPLIQLLTRLSE